MPTRSQRCSSSGCQRTGSRPHWTRWRKLGTEESRQVQAQDVTDSMVGARSPHRAPRRRAWTGSTRAARGPRTIAEIVSLECISPAARPTWTRSSNAARSSPELVASGHDYRGAARPIDAGGRARSEPGDRFPGRTQEWLEGASLASVKIVLLRWSPGGCFPWAIAIRVRCGWCCAGSLVAAGAHAAPRHRRHHCAPAAPAGRTIAPPRHHRRRRRRLQIDASTLKPPGSARDPGAMVVG